MTNPCSILLGAMMTTIVIAAILVVIFWLTHAKSTIHRVISQEELNTLHSTLNIKKDKINETK